MQNLFTKAVLSEESAPIHTSSRQAMMELYESMLNFEFKIVQGFESDLELRNLFQQLQQSEIERWMQPMVIGIDARTTRPLLAVVGVH